MYAQEGLKTSLDTYVSLAKSGDSSTERKKERKLENCLNSGCIQPKCRSTSEEWKVYW